MEWVYFVEMKENIHRVSLVIQTEPRTHRIIIISTTRSVVTEKQHVPCPRGARRQIPFAILEAIPVCFSCIYYYYLLFSVSPTDIFFHIFRFRTGATARWTDAITLFVVYFFTQ